MTNTQLFQSYDAELILRNQSKTGLHEARRVIQHFKDFLGEFPPTPEIGKQFLTQFSERKVTTKARYTQILKGFFDFYGEKLGVRVKVPHTLPEYTKDSEINALLEAMTNRGSHRSLVKRDLLLVQLGLKTGLRRAELSALEIRDIHLDQELIVVRNGKGGKDAVIPLNSGIKAMLANYITPDMKPEQKLFGLKPASISSKLEHFSKKAGVQIHPHTLRHIFGTKLVENGVNAEAVRQLMRHERLETTQRYISLAGKTLQDAVETLGGPEKPSSTKQPASPQLLPPGEKWRMSWMLPENMSVGSRLQELEEEEKRIRGY